jgi:hypothetical protein
MLFRNRTGFEDVWARSRFNRITLRPSRLLDNVGVRAKRNVWLARYADAVALPGLSLLQIPWFREFSCPPLQHS